MDIENNFIKPVLLFQFSKGKTELEAYDAISKQYGQYAITLKTISKWFKLFSIEYNNLVDSESNCLKSEFEDDYLLGLIKDNCDLNLNELEKLGNCSKLTISSRLSHIKGSNGAGSISGSCTNRGETLNYNKKDLQKIRNKLTDEYLINLVNNNPNSTMSQIAKLAGKSQGYISRKLKQIYGESEDTKGTTKVSKVENELSKKAGYPKKFNDEKLINLINNNPDYMLKDLAKVLNTSITTISNRLKEINSRGEKVNYIRKKNKKATVKLTDDDIADLINNNPTLNLTELGKISNSSASVISRRLKQINKEEVKVNYTSKIIPKEGHLSKHKPRQKFTDEFLINLKKENPGATVVELAKIAGASRATMYSRLRLFNSSDLGEEGDQNSKCCKKAARGMTSKFTDEFIMELVNNNPMLNMRQLAGLAGTSVSLISRRLKKINTEGSTKVNYISKRVKISGFKTDKEMETTNKDEP